VNDSSFSSQAEVEQLQQTDSQENESDDCSPFCICSCCQIFTAANFPVFTVKNVYTVSIAHDTKIAYQNNYSQQHLNNIWQPPKFNL